MTLKEIRKKKLELRSKIQEARTDGDLEAIKEELLALQEAEKLLEDKINDLENKDDESADESNKEDENEEPAPEDEESLINEKSLIKNQNKNFEKRKLETMKINI